MLEFNKLAHDLSKKTRKKISQEIKEIEKNIILPLACFDLLLAYLMLEENQRLGNFFFTEILLSTHTI